MKRLWKSFLQSVVLAAVCCAPSMANEIWIDSDGDSLVVNITPAGGSVIGGLGDYVGWGFSVTWASPNGHWIKFTSSTLTAETQPTLRIDYVDLIGMNGGPDGDLSSEKHGVAPGSTWSQPYNLIDAAAGTGTGVAAYRITTGVPIFADDFGRLEFHFDLWDGQPGEAGASRLGSYAYSRVAIGDDPGTEVLVTVIPVPEPATAGLLLLSAGAMLAVAKRRAK